MLSCCLYGVLHVLLVSTGVHFGYSQKHGLTMLYLRVYSHFTQSVPWKGTGNTASMTEKERVNDEQNLLDMGGVGKLLQDYITSPVSVTLF